MTFIHSEDEFNYKGLDLNEYETSFVVDEAEEDDGSRAGSDADNAVSSGADEAASSDVGEQLDDVSDDGKCNNIRVLAALMDTYTAGVARNDEEDGHTSAAKGER